jgi:single-strand DNA-binding protein
MADLNRATLLGRLGRDPEIRTMGNGDKVASFTLATGEKWKDKASGDDKERTEWHSVVVFGPIVRVVEKYLEKGKRIYIEGAIRTRKWQDQSGNDRWSTEVVLSGFDAKLIMIDSAGGGGGGAAKGQEEAYGGLPNPAPRNDLDDEIPF